MPFSNGNAMVFAPISAFVSFDDQEAVEPAYESAIEAEVAQILEAIPHDQLAVQWDTNFEFSMLEGDLPAWFPDVKGGILERLIRLSRLIPTDVELGLLVLALEPDRLARLLGAGGEVAHKIGGGKPLGLGYQFWA